MREHLPDDRRDDQHQSDHDTRKVGTQDGVDDDKDVLIPKLPEAQVDTGGEEEDEHLQVEEEGWPRGRLVFRDRGDDGDCQAKASDVEDSWK